MSPQSRKEYFAAILKRYRCASKPQKRLILDEFCQTCGYNRKYAIRKLRRAQQRYRPTTSNRPGPRPRYQHPKLIEAIQHIWIAANHPCSKRLKELLPHWIGHYQDTYGYLPLEELPSVTRISPATIDRLLKPIKPLYRGIGRSTTKPGSILKQHIPIKTDQWNESQPGFLEADTVAHCGSSIEGFYAMSLTTVDIATGWTEQRATYGKSRLDIFKQLKDIEASLPFPLRGFDCDNGSEFLNQTIMQHFLKRANPVQFTRSRAYHKNDNAHVEGKNYTHVRQWLGYRRFEDFSIVGLLNDLYKNEWRLFHNFFMPSMKLLAKKRVGSKIIKQHDKPKTPFQRIQESQHITTATKKTLRQLYATLNPFKLRKTIDKKIATIHQLARLP